MTHLELPQDIGNQDLAGAGNVFGNRSFVLLWTAQLLSQLASNMVLAALMATIFTATGSNSANAVLILTFLVPAVAFSAVAGVFVERSDARLIMLAANVLRATGVVLFIFVGTHVGLILFINLFIATVTAFFVPAELTAIPRIVERRHLMAANSIFVLTVNATFAIGFGFLGPSLLIAGGANVVFVVVAVMFGLAAAAIIPLPASPPERAQLPAAETAVHALRAVFDQVTEGIHFVRAHRQIAWSLAYLGIAASLIGVMGAIGPGFATDILRLRPQDFFFVMGPAGLGAVIGILFLNAYGRAIPRRLVIDLGLVAMGITLIGLA
ncbi:MAG TPA: MFS transporter, partial [Candidatus Limnocylindrales bacterium]|nr:MFS transporter [Candidatus Limnocylindrales bacterium]